ncbi:AAA family ATPase [Wolbachia endosymbiont of Anurida maritima]|uniref:AAA family ATPase n=1 Tax=Wolbachia endosymbiont of Anurida maritima TaxID=2850562 RepID=UPI0035CEB876
MEEIINKTEGFSLGMLHSLVNTAKFNAASRIGKTDGETYVTKDDLEGALKKLTNKNNKTPTKPDRMAKVKLNDVAVSEDVRQELRKICKSQSKREIEIDEKLNYAQDTGYIFYGPPGTGKTLLAKAIANETESSFISVSASEFIQQYVGTGPENIRKLFEEARKKAPCIVFIDEIDSIGEKRCYGSHYGHQARTETLNQLLTALDGFESRKGVIVIAATNRIDVLDSALTRGSRLSKHINIPLPDGNLRKEILNLYMKDTPRTKDLDLTKFVGRTEGFSGADLFDLVNYVKDFARNRIVTEGTEEIFITTDDFTKPLEEIGKKLRKKGSRQRLENRQMIMLRLFLRKLPLNKYQITLRKVSVKASLVNSCY